MAQASTSAAVFVRSEHSEALAGALAGPGVVVEPQGRGAIEVHGLTGRQIGELALQTGIVLDELTPAGVARGRLQALTGDCVDYRSAADARVEVGEAAQRGRGAAPGPRRRADSRGVTFVRVLQSEWTKLLTLRSTLRSLLAAVVAMAGLGRCRRGPDVALVSHAAGRPSALRLHRLRRRRLPRRAARHRRAWARRSSPGSTPPA